MVDVIEVGKNNYCSPSFDDEDFYQTIRRALDERGKLSRSLIKKDYEDNYSMKACAQKYYDVYKKLLKK